MGLASIVTLVGCGAQSPSAFLILLLLTPTASLPAWPPPHAVVGLTQDRCHLDFISIFLYDTFISFYNTDFFLSSAFFFFFTSSLTSMAKTG